MISLCTVGVLATLNIIEALCPREDSIPIDSESKISDKLDQNCRSYGSALPSWRAAKFGWLAVLDFWISFIEVFNFIQGDNEKKSFRAMLSLFGLTLLRLLNF